MRKLIFKAACATAVAYAFAGVASAAPSDTSSPQGVVGGDYSYLDASGVSSHVNSYGANAAGVIGITSNWTAQLAADYHRLDAGSGGGSADEWSVAGAATWNPSWGRLGVNVGYNDLGVVGHVKGTNYGVYGEYYLNDRVTLGLRAGGDHLESGSSASGGYVGGRAEGYITPNLEVSGEVQYDSVNSFDQTRAGVRGEYLFSQSMPISIWGGYDNTSFNQSGAPTFNTYLIGVKYYFGGNGSSLVTRHRTGVDDFGTAAFRFLY